MGGERAEHRPAEAGGVGHEQGRAVAAEVVNGQAHAVGGGQAGHRRRLPSQAVTTDLEVRGSRPTQAFYAAFEARDLDAMSIVWEHSDRIVCTHPGWASLRGWGQVAASFFALFQNSQHLQFILTKETAEVAGDMAWVAVDENILQATNATTVAALNLFVRDRRRRVAAWSPTTRRRSATAPTPDVASVATEPSD